MFRVVIMSDGEIVFKYSNDWMNEGEATHVAQCLDEFAHQIATIQYRHSNETEESDWREW